MNFIVSENPGIEWDKFVSQHTDVLFCSSLWSEVLRQGLGGKPCYMYLKNSDGIVCGMPGVILKYFGIKLYYSNIPYGGYIGRTDLFDDFMERVIVWTKSIDILYVIPCLHDSDCDYTKQFKTTTELMTQIDLKGRNLDEVQSRFSPSVRQSVNKGGRLGVEVQRRNDRECYLIAYRLYLQTMERNRAIVRYAQKWFVALYDILAERGLSFIYLAYYNGNPVSATVVINSESSYHLIHSGSSTGHLWLRANDLVVCEIIKDAIQDRKEVMDLMLANSKDTDLIRWKEKFGGCSSPQYTYRKVNSQMKDALWNRAKQIYPFFQRFPKVGGAGHR